MLAEYTMTLILALSSSSKLCIAGDTRAVSMKNGPIADPVEKVRIINNPNQSCIVAVAGESKINGMLLLEHVEARAEDLFDYVGIGRFTEYLFLMWEQDVSNWRWDDAAEKNGYIESSYIDILIAPSTNIIYRISGSYSKLNATFQVLPSPIIPLGLHDLIPDPLRIVPDTVSEWDSYIGKVFKSVSSRTENVSPPIDIITWDALNQPSQRRVTIENLENKK